MFSSACRRFDFRRFGLSPFWLSPFWLSPFWLSPFWLVAVLTIPSTASVGVIVYGHLFQYGITRGFNGRKDREALDRTGSRVLTLKSAVSFSCGMAALALQVDPSASFYSRLFLDYNLVATFDRCLLYDMIMCMVTWNPATLLQRLHVRTCICAWLYAAY